MDRSTNGENGRSRREALEAKKRRWQKTVIAETVLAVLALIGFVAARYVAVNQREAQIHASEFHFSSNYLESKEQEALEPLIVSDWGDHSVRILLYNYEKDNVALISDSDVRYTVSVDEGWSVTSVINADGTEAKPDKGVYTMQKSGTCINQELTIAYAGEGEPDAVRVTVTSVSPYEKTLTADFSLSVKRTPDFTVTDMGDYDVVSIESNDYHGEIQVSWNGEMLSPDNTNSCMADWTNSGKQSAGKFQADEFTTYILIFLEDVSGDYSKADFAVDISGE